MKVPGEDLSRLITESGSTAPRVTNHLWNLKTNSIKLTSTNHPKASSTFLKNGQAHTLPKCPSRAGCLVVCSCAIFLFAFAPKMLAANSPLADAAEKSDHAAIQRLLKQRVEVNAPQADGTTALHWAARL